MAGDSRNLDLDCTVKSIAPKLQTANSNAKAGMNTESTYLGSSELDLQHAAHGSVTDNATFYELDN